MRRTLAILALGIAGLLALGFSYTGDGSDGFSTGENLTATNLNELDSALDDLENFETRSGIAVVGADIQGAIDSCGEGAGHDGCNVLLPRGDVTMAACNVRIGGVTAATKQQSITLQGHGGASITEAGTHLIFPASCDPGDVALIVGAGSFITLKDFTVDFAAASNPDYGIKFTADTNEGGDQGGQSTHIQVENVWVKGTDGTQGPQVAAFLIEGEDADPDDQISEMSMFQVGATNVAKCLVINSSAFAASKISMFECADYTDIGIQLTAGTIYLDQPLFTSDTGASWAFKSDNSATNEVGFINITNAHVENDFGGGFQFNDTSGVRARPTLLLNNSMSIQSNNQKAVDFDGIGTLVAIGNQFNPLAGVTGTEFDVTEVGGGGLDFVDLGNLYGPSATVTKNITATNHILPSTSGDITAAGPMYASGAAFTDGVASTSSLMFVIEGTTVDTNEYLFTVPSPDPGEDILYQFPNSTGNLTTTQLAEEEGEIGDATISGSASLNAVITGTAANAASWDATPAIDLSDATALNATQLTSGTVPVARVGAAHIDDLTEITAVLKSGTAGTKVVTLTGSPTNGQCAIFDANGDVAGGACAGGSSLFTQGAGWARLTSATDDLALGWDGTGDPSTAAALWFDESAGDLRIDGTLTVGAQTNPQMIFDDSDSASETQDALISVQATDVGAGTEDVDVTISTQVNSVSTARITINADGNTTIPSLDIGSTGIVYDTGTLSSADLEILDNGAIDAAEVAADVATQAELDAKSAATSTDNAIARYDSTAGDLQNSGVTIDDSNNVSIPADLNLTGTGATCFIIRDNDDAGDTACWALNGTFSCEIDTNGVCNDAI